MKEATDDSTSPLRGSGRGQEDHKDQKDHGGTSLTEADAVSVLVPTPKLTHAAPQCANGVHEWSNDFGDDWTPEYGDQCDCGKKQWGIPIPVVATEPLDEGPLKSGRPMTVQQARDVLIGDIRYCLSAVRGNSSAPVGDCSVFVDELIAAVRAESDAGVSVSVPALSHAETPEDQRRRIETHAKATLGDLVDEIYGIDGKRQP